MEYKKNLQYILACLSTHAQYLNEIKGNPQNVRKYFVLSDEEYNSLKIFFQDYFNKVYNYAILMEEKRWQEVQMCLKYSILILGKKQLYCYWKKYLSSFSILTNIPASPIEESIQFISYILKLLVVNKHIESILIYEILKNKTIIFNLNKANFANIISFNDNLSSYKGYPNPSLIINRFDCAITKIINDLHIKSTSFCQSYENQDILCFLKNSTNNSIVILKLHEDHLDLISNIVGEQNMQVWVDKNQRKYSHDYCIKIINSLLKNNLIFLKKIGVII